MIRESEELPRWVQRRDDRSAGRYGGNKVVRWISRPDPKGRANGSATGADGAATAEWPRITGFGMLRLVSDH